MSARLDLSSMAYRRVNVLEGETLVEVNPLVLEVLQSRRIDTRSVLHCLEKTGRPGDGTGPTDDLKRLFVTALEVPPSRHLEIQAAFQQQVDNSVSKTVDLPQNATTTDVAGVFPGAAELGLKGITVYRYGSKSSQVMELGVDEESFARGHAARCDSGECMSG